MFDLLFVKWKESSSDDEPLLRISCRSGVDTTEEYPVLVIPLSENPQTNEALVRCVGEKICQFDGDGFCENNAYFRYGYFQLEHYEVDEVVNVTQLIGEVFIVDITKIFNYYVSGDGLFKLDMLIKDAKEGKVVP